MSTDLEQFKKDNPLPASNNGTVELKRRWKVLQKDPEFFELVCEKVSGGMAITQFCREHDLKSNLVLTWLKRFKDDDPRKAHYEAARQARAEYFADRIIEIIDLIQAGTLTPSAARVMIDSLRWLAARLDPHIWGDKLHIDAKVATTTELHLAAVREMAKRVQAGKEAQKLPIDDEEPVEDAEFVDPADLLQ